MPIVPGDLRVSAEKNRNSSAVFFPDFLGVFSSDFGS